MGRPTLIQRWSRLVAVGVRDLSAAEFTVWSSWCGLLLALESLGRRSGEEWVDFGAAVALLLWSAATAVVHQARPLRLISALRKFLPRRAMLVRHLMLDWGVDLRRTPPIRRRLPGAWCVLAFGILAASVAVWLAVTQSPSGVRNWLASRFYLAYLVPWAALVGVALFLISVLTFLIWAELQEHSESRSRAGRPPGGRRDLLVIAIAAALLVLGVGYLKTWIPLAGMGVVLAGLSIALLLTSRDLVLIWRQEIRGRYGSFDGRLFIWFQAAAVIVLLADLALLLGGRPELPRGFDWGVSPLVSAAKLPPPSLILARLIGWLSLGAAIGVGFDACRLAILGITFHPSRIGRTEGRDLAAADFGVRRQAEVKCRRKIVRGLERLFKRADRRQRAAGSGLLLGPQHWFILGMRSVEGDESAENREQRIYDGFVGPPFHEVFPRLARYHFWQLATALQIDLIYVEDTVSFRRLVRVLRVLFEIYDMHAGAQRAEDRHFQGLPGVRVMIYDVDAGTIQPREESELAAAVYPEPEYRELDRARVLHVFRDREDSEVDEPVPGVSNWAPDLSSY